MNSTPRFGGKKSAIEIDRLTHRPTHGAWCIACTHRRRYLGPRCIPALPNNTTDRRILFFFTYLSGRRALFLANKTTDRRILYFLTESVWPSSAVPSQRTVDGLTTDRRILYFLTESVWPSSVVPSDHDHGP
jgi:hypothetical protein